MKPIEVVTGNCHFHIKRVISSTDVIQLTLTLNVTSAQVVKKSVTVIKSPNFRTTFTRTIILDLLMKLMTPGLRPFTVLRSRGRRSERLANDYVSYANTRTTTLVQLPLQRSRLCSERTLNLSPRWTHKRPVKSPRPPVDDWSEHGWTTVTEDSTTTTKLKQLLPTTLLSTIQTIADKRADKRAEQHRAETKQTDKQR